MVEKQLTLLKVIVRHISLLLLFKFCSITYLRFVEAYGLTYANTVYVPK